jgi:hypothetical protein
MKPYFQAVCAGLCAALASVFAKLAMAGDTVSLLCLGFMQATFYSSTSLFDGSILDHYSQLKKSTEFCSWVVKLLQID